MNAARKPRPVRRSPSIRKDTVNADFGYRISLGCTYDTVHYSHTQQNGINQWLWNFDNQQFSTAQNPVIVYDVFGMKQATLIVTNGFCSDTATREVFLKDTGSRIRCYQAGLPW